MCTADLPAVTSIQQACYPTALREAVATCAGRLANCPDTSWVAADAQGVCGYLDGYRSRLGQVAALDGLYHHAAVADCLYLHDLAVHPRVRSQGVAQSLLAAAELHAHRQGLGVMALTAVLDTPAYWHRRGFEDCAALAANAQATLEGYGVPARYLVRWITAR
ncbi:MAG: GNAT family N-acetyltransferase [Steroidobacteraceae bacterium]